MNQVSVIIPVFNREKFISSAIDSVLKQTKKAYEIIIVDDGSSDNTKSVVSSYLSKKYVPVKYVHQNNKGPAAARNIGVKEAKGDLIAFLDSDDTWGKRKLEKQTKALALLPHYNISHTGEKWYRRGQHLNQKKIHQPKSGKVFYQCLRLCAVGMSTVMIRKNIFNRYGLFDETLQCCEDYEFWLRVGINEQFLLIDSPLTIKNGGREDQVSAIHRLGMDSLRIYSLEKLLYRNSEKFSKLTAKSIAAELIYKCEIYGRGCIKHGQIETGQQILNKIEIAKNYINNLEY